MTASPARSSAVIGILMLVGGLWPAGLMAADPEPPADSLATYLASWDLDRSEWTPLEAEGAWDAARQSLVLKLMARLGRVPAATLSAWQAAATDVSRSLPTAARPQRPIGRPRPRVSWMRQKKKKKKIRRSDF